eukprot:6346032-Amphidinium_carterae.2
MESQRSTFWNRTHGSSCMGKGPQPHHQMTSLREDPRPSAQNLLALFSSEATVGGPHIAPSE